LPPNLDSSPPISVLKAIGLIVVATACAAGMNILVKQLTLDLHPYVIGFFRCLFGIVVLLPLLVPRGALTQLKTKRLRLHVLRAALHLITMLSAFFAIGLTPVAKVVAIKFGGPLFASILAILWLRERIHTRRAVALLVGFAGMLVIIQPGSVELEPGVVYAIGSAACWAFMAICIKLLSRTETSIAMTFYLSILTTPMAFLLALNHWQYPTWEQLILLMGMGFLGSFSHLCIAEAYKSADVTVLTPFDFFKLIWVAFLGFLIFDEIPTLWTWVGGAMIFSATVYIAYRERQLRQQA
jgi:drug/metabolite transporter (DMT)-like permease